MNINEIFASDSGVTTVVDALQKGSRQLVTGLLEPAKQLFLSTIIETKSAPILYVTDSLARAEHVYNLFKEEQSEIDTYWFPAEEIIAAEVATSSPNYRTARIQFLSVLATSKTGIFITSTSGLRRLVPEPKDVIEARITLEVGAEYEFQTLISDLNALGYQRVEQVEKKGEFAVRGSVVDIFPLNQDDPIRMDFFDIEIDSLRTFDQATQRSIENIEKIEVLPATDLIINETKLNQAIKTMNNELAQAQKKLSEENFEALQQNINEVIERWKHHQLIQEDTMYAKQLYAAKTSLLDYLTKGTLVLDDYPRILDAETDIENNEASWIVDQLKNNVLLDNESFGVDIRTLIKKKSVPQLFLSMFQKGMGRLKFDQLTEITTRAVQDFFGQMPVLKGEVERWLARKQTVLIFANSKERQGKITEVLHDFEIAAQKVNADRIQMAAVNIIGQSFPQGFDMPSTKLVVLTEKELFAKVPKKRPRQQHVENAERLKSYTELKTGDYVVHVNHGIGKFMGMTTMEVDGVHQDYMTIQYKGSGQLFIPVTQLNLVQKYVAAEGKSPKLNKLGGSDWAKTKKNVASKIEDIADDLIELYAKREAEKGFAFKPDDSYQRQFDNDFPYTETPDQLRSIEEIKKDMERERPMDRLLVGDVGYGKTEVALRAAFKAVESGKQVAILVPTTILAQQHFDTMNERFEGYPIATGILSRFQTGAQVKETLEGLKDGSVDVIVGTHRLLSKDVEFKDLGLLVIDEEQRFGVKHKERIKELKSQVDVLTLTATPIPRTLNMSMIGVRDLSVIETPPTNRYPIQTYVMEENAGAIREGIMREMRRNGQVFYLHNRVQDIEKVVAEIEALVPEARVGYIHGQMTEKQLEDILFEFIAGEYDVLVTTTIIETGIDIPNANTLFVENADHMGLSQLYQLRGRIGRSSRVAYAYFLYQKNRVLTELGEKRLEAIKDFTELGSGFKIAMRDLSIRGAGNLLGKQQHGFIDSVGYDLYSQMLADAVKKKQGKKVKRRSDSEISLGIEGFLPSSYIEDEQQKIEFYKRLRQANSHEEVVDIQDDMLDRFGDYPAEVDNLLQITDLKIIADQVQVERITRKDGILTVTMTRAASQKLTGEQIFEALSVTRLRATVAESDAKMHIKLVIQPRMTQKDWFTQLFNYIEKLKEYV
ncbi:transcription-repair coupling factor [Pediococcus pentosaceus]|jgi:transcription-repair coupling factor (superfamily II helicase)|uniref:Transcription-repair-coupling factor n=1 Tax=Pediococcus pentosaceus TaxID=1255 RepID=A0A6L5A2H5_PEDPE|nr:transcription-repair coupling factor [Pediococcus pentosaceus]KAF0351887.1 transcription-repair coupling factor [Pediococcus pentosaceus]KAF0414230.1 transcription-repair coupling factor [Pediococcus pentosaceus]KAF0503639.1 transcription-repair coupling factor [Pediococcus pentosaceus]MBF7120177.1 transcription-repair coupling factor [Pediococcus pentosaceus]MBF7126799.1 transcription-repair coupling factor [Pediococcus pentosaceus]